MQRKKTLCRRGLLWLTLGVLLVAGCGPRRDAHPGILRYNIHGGLTSLDPAFASTLNNMLVSQALFTTLVGVDTALGVVPRLAHWWDVRDSGRTYVFHLRRDAFFHDDGCFAGERGRRITASDVVYSLRRLMDSATASPGAWLFRDRVVASPGGSYRDGFQAPDDTTVIIRLVRPFGPFLGMLALPYCGIVPPEAVERYGRDGFGRHPVGSGPFRFHYWAPGKALSLLRHPHYFRKNGKDALPYLEGLFFSFIDNPESEFLAFLSGRIDVLAGAQKALTDFFLTPGGAIKPALRTQYRWQRAPFLNTEYLGILQDTALLPAGHPLRNRSFRKALSFAIDRGKMLRYLRRNVGTPGRQGITPPGLLSGTPGYTYHRDSARYYLRQAFREGVRKMPLDIATTGGYLDLCLFVARSWQQLGIPTRVTVRPAAAHRQRMLQGELPIFRASWIADYPDAESYLSLFYSGNIPPHGPNYTRFQSPYYDSLYRAALSMTSRAGRTAAYRAMEAHLRERVPFVVLYYDETLRIFRRDISGLAAHPMGWIDWARIQKRAPHF